MTDEETKAACTCGDPSCPECGGKKEENTAAVAGEETVVPEATETEKVVTEEAAA